MPHKKGHPAPRSVEGAAKVESTGNVGKPKAGEKRYSSGAPARGTQTRKDILADMQRLVNYVKTGKFKNYKEKQKVWAQIDNFRVALGTLKEEKRKSKSNATGTTTYAGGTIKVRKEEGFSRDSGRGGGRKSTQMADGGKGKVTPKPPKPPTPPKPPVGNEPWTVRGERDKYAAGDWRLTETGRRELQKAGIYKGKKYAPGKKPAVGTGGR